jgi:SecD/SecF fusion protein
MIRKLRWKLVVLLVVVVGTSAFAWLPPVAEQLRLRVPGVFTQKRLLLGLDLRGGVQFVLRVNADEVIGRPGSDQSGAITRADVVAQAKEAIDRRINALGVTEPMIAVQGERGDEILVQLPGFTDVERAREILGSTARLELRLVKDGSPAPVAAVTGADIRRAWVTRDDIGQPAVGFSLTPDGTRRFADVTSANIGRQLAILLDDAVQSAPVIETAITQGEGIIRGGFTMEQATDLALLLRAGALPVSMTFLGGQYVGATLGTSAVQAGVAASLGGLVLVGAFVLAYYRRAGVNAIISLVANMALLLGVMAYFGAALTLPGIAGLILTIGMGVDSNVLILERIKEELRAGQSLRRAISAGFDRVFVTILDTHVASLVAAAFLFQFGSGAVRGFATILSLGLLINVFTAVVVSRTMFEWTLARGGRPTLGSERPGLLAALGPIDVMRHRTLALWLSAAVIVASLALTVVRGLPLGLDFTGGAAAVAEFDSPVDEERVRQAIPDQSTVQRYGARPDRTFQIRVPQPSGAIDGDEPMGLRAVETALAASSLPPSRIVGTTTIGPTMGTDLQRKSTYAMAGAVAGITAYLALRFRPSFAAGAAIASVHDIIVTVAMLSVAGYDLDLNVVAALLTVAGYSVNDTIVIFDRVRERLRRGAGGTIEAAVNAAVTDTLGRTLITSGTTLVAVLSLYLFGGAALGGFAFTVMVGIIAGTWSTVFVAAPMAALMWTSRSRARDGVPAPGSEHPMRAGGQS